MHRGHGDSIQGRGHICHRHRSSLRRIAAASARFPGVLVIEDGNTTPSVAVAVVVVRGARSSSFPRSAFRGLRAGTLNEEDVDGVLEDVLRRAKREAKDVVLTPC